MNPPFKAMGWRTLLTFVLLFTGVSNASAVTIVRNFIGGAAPQNTAGGGNLVEIFNAAADLWEKIILDPHTVTLNYGWAPLHSAGVHFLNAQGGAPHRETEGTILFDNDGNSGGIEIFLDPTPHRNEEYLTFRKNVQDLGGGPMDVGRLFTHPVGTAIGRIDLFSIALHEIGHALGLSEDNRSFVSEGTDGEIDLFETHPFPGTTIPLALNHFGATIHFNASALAYGSLMAGVNVSERRIPSTIDILANAQISQYTKLNLAVPLPQEMQGRRTDTPEERPLRAEFKRRPNFQKNTGLWGRNGSR